MRIERLSSVGGIARTDRPILWRRDPPAQCLRWNGAERQAAQRQYHGGSFFGAVAGACRGRAGRRTGPTPSAATRAAVRPDASSARRRARARACPRFRPRRPPARGRRSVHRDGTCARSPAASRQARSPAACRRTARCRRRWTGVVGRGQPAQPERPGGTGLRSPPAATAARCRGAARRTRDGRLTVDAAVGRGLVGGRRKRLPRQPVRGEGRRKPGRARDVHRHRGTELVSGVEVSVWSPSTARRSRRPEAASPGSARRPPPSEGTVGPRCGRAVVTRAHRSRRRRRGRRRRGDAAEDRPVDVVAVDVDRHSTPCLSWPPLY